MQNMVSLYGAGERTGILNVEAKLAKVLDKQEGTLVIRASERDTVLNEISARIARVEKYDPETGLELRRLRNNVKDIFNKGLDPGDDLMEQLWFLDSKTKDYVEKLSRNYNLVVTPQDFRDIAKIMGEYLGQQVPILKEFTKYFGKLAEAYLTHAKPSQSAIDWKAVGEIFLLGDEKKGYKLPPLVAEFFGLNPDESLSYKMLKRLSWWKDDTPLSKMIYGAASPEHRRTGFKVGKGISYFLPEVKLDLQKHFHLKVKLFEKNSLVKSMKFFYTNDKLPRKWTNVPWVNFDGKTIEQNFTQTFEERLVYKDKYGNWTTNILQVPQKSEADWWDQILNEEGKINDIADATKARTAFAVNGNHSNDAVIVKKFHLWGQKTGTATSTIHDAFFANAADMLKARKALRGIYAETMEKNVVQATLDEMLKRGLPKEIYDEFLEEAIRKGIIPVPGKSTVGGKILDEEDILEAKDILEDIVEDFSDDHYWYGVG